MDEALDEDAGGVNLVGVELAGLDDDLGFGDGDAAAGGGVGIEVARGAAVDEVAVGVGLPGFDEGEVGVDGALEEVVDGRRTRARSLPLATSVPTPVRV